MPLYRKVAGSLYQINDPYVDVGGSAYAVEQAYVKVGGSLYPFLDGGTIYVLRQQTTIMYAWDLDGTRRADKDIATVLTSGSAIRGLMIDGSQIYVQVRSANNFVSQLNFDGTIAESLLFLMESGNYQGMDVDADSFYAIDDDNVDAEIRVWNRAGVQQTSLNVSEREYTGLCLTPDNIFLMSDPLNDYTRLYPYTYSGVAEPTKDIRLNLNGIYRDIVYWQGFLYVINLDPSVHGIEVWDLDGNQHRTISIFGTDFDFNTIAIG